ncbi:MAG: DNA polymerase III subunit beta [Holosporales bacterium]|jgi:DNA polymerase-3 subunit beta|nr:DNA polymerase III subunit beta [Holosporales bacterium]
MKLTVNQKVLEKALAHATWIIEKKQAVPVLGYILFATTPDKRLSITATNMDMTINDVLDCQVVEDGQYCLPAGLLHDITRKMSPGSNVTFEFDKSANSIKMTSDRASFSIHYIEADSFPPIAAMDYPVSFQMNTKTFKKAIDVAKVAMLLDNTRFHLNGIHWHYENDLGQNKICFVATDLFRISCVSTSAPAIAQKMEPIIVSKRAVWEMLKLIDGSSDEELKISISENRILFSLVTSDGILSEFSSRLINGTFPEYKAALNVSNDKVLEVNTKDFVAALDRVSTVVMDSTSSVKLEISRDKLTLTGISRELGSATEEIDASFNAFEPLEICFNSRFLLEILREIETPQVTILLAESKSSTIIKPTVTGAVPVVDMCFAVMPIEVVNS